MSERSEVGHVDVWQSPDVQAVVERHTAELVGAGVTAAYAQGLREFADQVSATRHSPSADLMRAAAEVPGVLLAGLNQYERDEEGITLREYILLQVDPITGRQQSGTRLEVGEKIDETVNGIYHPFTEDHLLLVERHVTELEAVGIELTQA